SGLRLNILAVWRGRDVGTKGGAVAVAMDQITFSLVATAIFSVVRAGRRHQRLRLLGCSSSNPLAVRCLSHVTDCDGVAVSGTSTIFGIAEGPGGPAEMVPDQRQLLLQADDN